MSSNKVQVFSVEECNRLIKNNKDIELNEKARQMVFTFFKSKNFTLKENAKFNCMFFKIVNTARTWHFDDIALVNFIICIKGEGTLIYENNEIIQLNQGEGYFVIGDQGYAFLNLEPTFHKAPDTDYNDRLMMRVMVTGVFDINSIVEGPTVNQYDSEKYRNNLDYMYNVLEKELLQKLNY